MKSESSSSSNTARVILNKLKLVDPTVTNTTFSAYQQSAEIRQLWQSVESSIKTIVNISSCSAAANNKSLFDASIQVISILSASTLLSSIIHALITTQRRLNKSDEIIESIPDKEIEVILYHIQILKRNLNRQSINKKEETQSPQEAILQHMDILVDSLVAYSLSPSTTAENFPVLHPYKVSASTSFLRRYSQPATLIRTQSSSTTNDDEKLLQYMPATRKTPSNQDDNRYNLVSSKSTSSSRSRIMTSTKEKTNTVGKKFMRSLQHTFSHHSHNSHMTQQQQKRQQQQQLPSRQNSMIMNEAPSLMADEPKMKIQHNLHDHRDIINEQAEQEDPDPSDNDNISLAEEKKKKGSNGGTLRFILNAATRRKSAGVSLLFSCTVKTKRSSSTSTTTPREIKELFQSSPGTATITKKQKQRTGTNTNNSSGSSLMNVFNNNNNNKKQQQLAVVNNNPPSTMQGPIYSSTYSSFSSATSSFTASTSFSSSATENTSTPMKKISTKDGGTEMILTMSQRPSFLISPFTKKTNIQWTNDNNDSDDDGENTTETEEEPISSSFDSYTMDTSTIPLTRKPSNKKRRQLSSTPITKDNLPLPPLPPATTVENFLTILNALPGSPNSSISSYFSARSSSSSTVSSSTSTLDSILLDDAVDSLTKAGTEYQEEEEEKFHPLQPVLPTTTAPIPPPKDSRYNKADMIHQRNVMNPSQNHNTSNINNKQEKGSNSTSTERTSLIIHPAQMKISTSDVPSHLRHDYSPTTPIPKSVHINNKSNYRPPIPPRTSSMPLPPPHTPPKDSRIIQPPPIPADAKRKASAPINSARPSTAKSIVEHSGNDLIWTHLLGHKDVRAKLGRSLNTNSSSTTTNNNNSSKKIQPSAAALNSSDISNKASLSSGKLLKVIENGQVVLLFEMMAGKLQPIAGTPEKLFERLADETAQDMDYVDIYLMNHVEFTSSMELLNLLINRFHLEPSPGEYEYFVKWQFSIQTKVLTVIERWIERYYQQDFKENTVLQKRLCLFLYHDGLLQKPQFKQQLDKIRFILKSHQQQNSNKNTNSTIHHLSQLLHLSSSLSTTHHTSNSNFNFSFPFVNSSQYTASIIPNSINHNVHNNPKRPPLTLASNNSTTLFSFAATPPADALSPSPPHHLNNTAQLFSSLESKEIARYLTLADYYLFKLILLNNVSHGFIKKSGEEVDYIDLMTKRANMLSHWVVHEICIISHLKQKRALLKKFIEIAKLCLEHKNFHTCMVLTMGLLSCHTLSSLKETWDALSNRDLNSFYGLQKLLNVSLNMRYYRQKINQKSCPVAIPFLPVVLKDQTFLKENSTWTISHPQHLINFSKFRSITQFVNKTKAFVQESYWFAQDLTRFYFLNGEKITEEKENGSGQLDQVGEWIENRLYKVQDCYLDSSCYSSGNDLL